jgi:hypothetical protein
VSSKAGLLSFDPGQLDLFAEAEAAEDQRRIDAAPTLFDTEQRGYFVRVAAAEQWAQDYGSFDCHRRSHAWHAAAIRSDTIQPTESCRPVVLTAALHCNHYDGDCLCVGDTVYRGACRYCTWEGPLHDGENPAAEDAHDHAWPGWRDLPLVPRRPDSASNSKQTSKAIARWVDHVNAVYPTGWLESAGPIRTRRDAYGTRHVPDHTGFGGYDLCGDLTDQQDPR